ncbi:ArsR/SmtB family transcription factor [Mycolicibacterium lutetiense]|jgi:DNA-binding transcriptional ArsR family regulator|uniref:DNA-binding transcriptional ArsR family regulator n=1 Tax=Mycolicibacterium lutetiense TaxID=1641992 RepID=A0ABS4ZMS2_9MYCO|nr:helix-turn-helix domain-containing protein [Mycolicibacterium lutetiense]MBP2450787.1 DNA-binding transcriptional ArsR family regulator [Mycolicibacterium lutetiense]
MTLGVVLAALADPHRRRVVTELAAASADVERTCSSFTLQVTKSTATHHFRVLSESGLIQLTDYGNRKGVLLRREEIDRRFPGLLSLLVAERGQQVSGP